MENRVIIDTEKGWIREGRLSQVLTNICLNEFSRKFLKRGVSCLKYIDGVVLFSKSKRVSKRFLESSTKYLKEKVKF